MSPGAAIDVGLRVGFPGAGWLIDGILLLNCYAGDREEGGVILHLRLG